jgi:tetratricopeptide (TPR) repeat protein
VSRGPAPLSSLWWAIALWLAAPAPANPAQDAAAVLGECEAATQASDWDTAVIQCEAAIRELPDTYAIHYFLGFAYQQKQQWKEAATAFEAFLSAAEGEPEGQTRLTEQIRTAVRGAALARFRAGEREPGFPLLRRAAETDPTDAEVAFFLGLGLLEQGDHAGAESAFAVVSREAPQISQVLFFLGQLRYEAADYEAARGHLDRYLQSAPAGSFRADAHWMAGSMALRNTESGTPPDVESAENEALRHFTAFLKLETDTARAAVAHYFLGTIAADREECEEARRHYRVFLSIAPEHERASDVQGYLEEGFGSCEALPGDLG